MCMMWAYFLKGFPGGPHYLEYRLWFDLGHLKCANHHIQQNTELFSNSKLLSLIVLFVVLWLKSSLLFTGMGSACNVCI